MVSFPSSKRWERSNVLVAILLIGLQVVEILFARGLVKVLFATETFAMVCSTECLAAFLL